MDLSEKIRFQLLAEVSSSKLLSKMVALFHSTLSSELEDKRGNIHN